MASGENGRTGRARQRAYCVGVSPTGDDLSELKELLRTAGVAVVGELVQHRERPHPNLFLGPGKVDELKPLLKAADANLVAVDDELTPRQERNLEVELAQLEYNMARMRGLWTHLERLGAGRGVGGIGTRGPGESQIETDRRLARDRLFHTLDPTTRTLLLQGRTFLMTDTVGFIRKLPHQLVDAFAATLEETALADLVLHVVDASEPEEALVEMTRAVEDVLEEIHAADSPRVLVLNKADALDG